MLEYRVFIKEIYNLRGSLLQTAIVNRGNSCKPKPKKSFLSCVSEQSYISFLEFSKCTNLEWFFFLIFTFASQRRLLELLSYGEYNQLFISVICFLKTTHLSASRFHAFIFSSCRIKSTHTFFCCWKILIIATEF